MERTLMDKLVEWKASSNRKPLLLYGARQVGKTWLLEDFGRREYKRVVRVDFLKEASLRPIFQRDLDVERIVREIALRKGTAIDQADTLLILDEIQEAPGALTSLKYFCEDMPELHVAAAGSYMGIAKHEGESFPVGKVDSLTLRPMGFLEFLDACGQEMLASAIRARDFAAIERSARDLAEEHLRNYLFVGGMPEAVSAFTQRGSFEEARDIQLQIVSDYDGDFSKHAPARLFERMRLVWRSLPSQLAHENRRFVYGAVRKGARAKDLEESIQWLRDYGVVRKVPRATALRVPLASYEDLSAFKLFCVDVGLLGALADLPAHAVVEGSRLFTEFKGSLTEQYIMQELLLMGAAPYYWAADNATSEVDFAVGLGGCIAPIEVKAAENLRARSLRVACERFAIPKGVRTSLSGYRDDGWLVNIPLWGFSQLREDDLC
ncbi:MAG: ATP-binding protein [Eggerthellaceae bacterium]|nr:ATP-binding protein [Eggerthellaceae bacterium]